MSAGAGELPGVVSENRSPQSEGEVDDIPPAKLKAQVEIAFLPAY